MIENAPVLRRTTSNAARAVTLPDDAPRASFVSCAMCARCLQHEAAARELGQVAIDADREFAAKEAAFRGKESHLEDTLKARRVFPHAAGGLVCC